MNEWIIVLLSAVSGYLIGSISFARIIFAILKPGVKPEPLRTPTKDGLSELVSHSIGATNVMIVFGPRWGLLTTASDIFKAFIPTLIFRLVFPDKYYFLICAVAVLTGHLWPVWYSFCGGGGNSGIIGMLLAISPLGLLVTHIGGMIIGSIFPLFAFLGGVILMIPWFAIQNGVLSEYTLFAVVVNLLYVAGQLPEAIQMHRLKRDGHILEIKHIMHLMKKSAKTGHSGMQIIDKEKHDIKEFKSTEEKHNVEEIERAEDWIMLNK